MRPQLIVLLCTTAACGFTSQVFGTSLEFSLDLLGPCSGTTCSGTHPTNAGFQLQANSFSYAASSDNSGSFGLATLGLGAPMVCDEIAQSGASGPTRATRISPHFANSTLAGGALDINSGGDSIVDLSSLSFDGSNPAGVTTLYSNYGTPALPAQVTCYNVNPVTGGARSDAPGPTGSIFHSAFEDHYADEPWVSVQTVNSPNATAPSGPSAPTPTNTMAYVVQIHNAASAIGANGAWRLTLGYDHQYFSSALSGTAPWACVLGSGIPQPGGTSGTCSAITLPYALKATDIQSATNSIYIYVDYTGSNAAVTNWSAMTSAFYPAVAAVFPPFGTYPQRFDDKVAVATANNVPIVNVTSIVCDQTSASCQLYGPNTAADGSALPPALVYTNTLSGTGRLTVDPVGYFVDPYGANTLPGNASIDAITPQAVACSDPNGIVAPVAGGFSVSSHAQGATQYSITFQKVGNVYVSGTATCLVTYATSLSGYSPRLVSAQQLFTVTMLPTTATHFSVSAPASAVAGSAFNSLIVTARDAAENVVSTYSGTVHFSSTDTQAAVVLPANTTLNAGTGTFNATLVTAGSRTITVTDTVSSSITGTSGSIAVSPGAAASFAVQALSPQTHGQQFQVSVTAEDAYGNTATGYGGTVHFTSTDGSAVLPADQALASGVASPLPLVTLNTVGTQTVTATDTANASVTGTSNGITVL